MRYILKNKFYIFLISIIDLIGNFLTLPFKIFKRKEPANINNILLIRLDHIGDVIYSTVIPQNLKTHYPNVKITFLVASWAKDILINNPYVDEIICYDAPWFDRKRKRIFELKKFFKLAGQLRRHNYDLGFDLRGDLRHILLMTLAGVKFRVGYGITGGGFLLNKPVNYREKTHVLEHNLDLLKDININLINRQPRLYGSLKDENFTEDFFKRNHLVGDNFIVMIHAFAGYPAKNWQDNKFAKLIDVLYNDYNAKIILIGSQEDKESNNNIIRLCRSSVINAAGMTSIGSLLALLKKADIFIGVDSGPSHIGALTDKPTVILYSGTNNAQEWAPQGNKVMIIQKDVPCKGCEKLDCKKNICMELISVEDVVKVIKEVVSSKL
jgi:lipopolysaccharide heptosyltransferase II